jgi:hypothetical protein
VEGDHTARHRPAEGQGEEHLRRHAFEHQFRRIPEAELPVVVRMPDQAAALCAQLLQPPQPFRNQRLADAPALVLRQHRHRPQAVPVAGAVRNRHRREGDMADHAAVRFRDQRNRQRLRRAQCRDDELLGVVADFQGS